MTWENRLEFRLADSENKWGLMSGLVKEIDSSWAWSGRAQIYQTSAPAGLNTTKVDLRYGLVYRPPLTQWIALDRLDLLIDNESGGTSASLIPGGSSTTLSPTIVPAKTCSCRCIMAPSMCWKQ